MQVTSPAYAQGGTMPARFAAWQVQAGGNVSVPISWSGAPSGTRSYVVVMTDRHPVARGWVHWLVISIPASASALPEGVSGTPGVPAGAVELENTSGRAGYGGPQPPPGTGVHDYETTVFALDVAHLGVEPPATWDDVSGAMQGHVLASGSLTGRFER